MQLLACLAIALVAPASLALAAAHGALSGFGIVVTASGLLPLLLSAYLIRQILDRARAEYRAQHDPLTRLPNRVLFEDRELVADDGSFADDFRGIDLYQRFGGQGTGYGNAPVALHVYEIPSP